MIRLIFLNCFLLFTVIISCDTNQNKIENNNKYSIQNSSTLEVDHLNIWVNNPTLAKQKLQEIGFTALPDSLSAIHKGQGTSGRYFNFLNGYLEFIFVYDSLEFNSNTLKNKKLDFEERANYATNNASPFSVALRLNNYNEANIPFEKIAYHQEWMEPNSNIYAAKNSKLHLNEPSVFVVYPKLNATRFKSVKELDTVQSEDDTWKRYFKHKNGAQNITNIIISSPSLELKTETIQTLNNLKKISLRKGTNHVMELYFDNSIQNKTYDLRPDLPLIIHL